MESRQVQAGEDVLLAHAERATAVEAIAELVWNGIDAEASHVNVTIEFSELEGPVSAVVQDNGHGMTYDKAVEAFTLHGDSWKKDARFSPSLRRPMHGRLGRGRFLSYALGQRVTWRTVAAVDDERTLTTIEGRGSKPNEFRFEGPEPTDAGTGTSVELDTTQSEKAAQLASEDFRSKLTARLAPSLHALDGVAVHFNSRPLDPDELIVDRHQIPIDVDPEVLFGKGPAELVVIEWRRDPKAPMLMLCDEHGLVVTDYEMLSRPAAPFHWTAYVLWAGFADSELMSHADLHVPQVRHRQLIDAAESALRSFIHEQHDRRRAALVQKWKDEGSYPFRAEPTSQIEKIERQLFDVVAVVASPRLGRTVKDHKFSLGLLRESMRSGSPGLDVS